jgi:hypothetical protein
MYDVLTPKDWSNCPRFSWDFTYVTCFFMRVACPLPHRSGEEELKFSIDFQV